MVRDEDQHALMGELSVKPLVECFDDLVVGEELVSRRNAL
jgi:hypothetical protein